MPPPTNCVTAPTGLVSWWRGEGNAQDEVGGNNGTLAGNTTFANAEVGAGLGFSGRGAGVVVGGATNLQLQNFTAEAAVKRARTAPVSSDIGRAGLFFSFGSGGCGVGF